MNYSESLDYLNRLGNEVLTMKFGLETIRLILSRMHDPHKNYPSVLVAGTNGKGSVSRMLSGVLTGCGHRTGLFTSPHLVSIRERIRVNGESISKEAFAETFSLVIDAVRTLDLEAHPTFFELVTATAIKYFSTEDVQVAVLEIGMGGRLDSSNAVEPELSIITPIGYDHQQFLGETLREIAREKAGIMRPGRPVVIALQEPEALESLREVAKEKGTHLLETSDDQARLLGQESGCFGFEYERERYWLSSPGEFQVRNAVLVLKAVKELRRLGFSLRAQTVRKSLEAVSVDGVLQTVQRDPWVLVDGGHNVGAARELRRFVDAFTSPPRSLIFSMMRDKQISEVFSELGNLFQNVYLVALDSPRAASMEQLTAACPQGVPAAQLGRAFARAARNSATVVVGGSFMLAGEFLSLYPRLMSG